MQTDNPDTLPTLTVIIVVRNGAGTLARAFDSLIAQHYPKVELIVWDGLSTDATPDVIARYSHIITTFRSQQDKGSCDAYNHSIALATGDYVGLLNADDEYEPGTLWAVAERIMANPTAEVISFGMIFRTCDKEGRSRVKGYYADERQLALNPARVLSEIPTFILARFYRRSLFAEVGPFNVERSLWYYSNDREFTARLALRGCRNVIIPKALYGFEVRDEGASSNPDNYMRIIEEHGLIADHFLQQKLSEENIRIVQHWQRRQLMIGFWVALFMGKFAHAKRFMRQGFALRGWRILPLAACLLSEKLLKRLGLKLSGGIDRGVV